jgi:hypothetical protein
MAGSTRLTLSGHLPNYRVDCLQARGADGPVLRELQATEMPDLGGKAAVSLIHFFPRSVLELDLWAPLLRDRLATRPTSKGGWI